MSHFGTTTLLATLLAALPFSNPVLAQDFETGLPPGFENRAPAPGYDSLTDNEQLVYNGVFAQCLQLVAANDNGELSGASERLLGRCGEIVFQNGEALDSLSDALRRTQAEEIEILGAQATEAAGNQLENVSNRMQALRAGAIGFSFGLASWEGQGLPVGGMASGDEFSRLGVFATFDYATGDRDGTGKSNGFDFDTVGATVGVDYRFTDSLVAGVAYQYSDADADVEQNYGDLSATGSSFTAYLTQFGENYYLEGTLGAGRYDYDTLRILDYNNNSSLRERLTASPEGDQFTWSLAGGYLVNGESLNQSYYVQARGVDLDIDSYTETTDNLSNGSMALTVGEQSVESTTVELGAQFSKVLSLDAGVLLPYLDVAWVSELEDGGNPVVANFANAEGVAPIFNFGWLTDEFDSTYFRVSAGSSLQMANGLVLYANYDTYLGLDRYDYHGVSLGFRKEL